MEECNSFSIHEVLNSPHNGVISWKQGESPAGSIRFLVRTNNGYPTNIDLFYSMGKETYQYTVPVSQTLTYWESPRYWFSCPNIRCNRRVAKLYRAPGENYFLCRHCYRLSYTSSQESHSYDRAILTDDGTGINHLVNLLRGDGLRAAIEAARTGNMSTLPKKLRKALREYSNRPENKQKRINRFMQLEEQQQAERAARYAEYLNASELCERSGITIEQLELLSLARLLVPDFEGRYRPKLVGWAGKLAYLIREGWTVEEIKSWSSGRWTTSNPRLWPPIRENFLQRRK